jgi:hypothetical protein
VLYIIPLYSGFALICAQWIMQWPHKLGSISVQVIKIYLVILSLAFFFCHF